MATRGRDLKVSILSDLGQFDTAPAARQLEQVGDAARSTGSDLSGLDDSAGRAGSSVDSMGRDLSQLRDHLDKADREVSDLGDEAKDTARKVDTAFESIAKSSKSNVAGDVKEASHSAKESLGEVGSESKDTAREMAASFSGSADDVKDAMQEVAANALASLGPVGAAIGIGAAVGIGYLRAQSEKLKQEVSDLTSALIDGGGRLGRQSVIGRIQGFAQDGSINDLANQAKAARVPVSDFLAAMAGDTDAMARSRQATKDARDELRRLTGEGRLTKGEHDRMADSIWSVEKALGGEATANEQAQQAIENLSKAGAENVQAQQDIADAIGSVVDPVNAYTTLMQSKQDADRAAAEATAAHTKSTSDDWSDYTHKVTVSVAEYERALEEQVTAQEQWASNLSKLAKRGVEEGTLAELARLGPEGAPLVAKLTKASQPELDKLVNLFGRKGAASTDAMVAAILEGRDPAAAAGHAAGSAAATGTARGMHDHTPAVLTEAGRVHYAAAQKLASAITIPVHVADARAQAAERHRQVQAALGITPVTIPVSLQNPRFRP